MTLRLPAVLAAAVSVLLLAACVAETVERRRPRKGPVEAVGFVDFGGGKTRYSLEGWSWFVAGRRASALRAMRRNCGRKLEPRIVDEYVRQDADASFAGEDVTTSMAHGGDHFRVERFMHMTYECRPKNWAEPVVTKPAAAPTLVIPPISASTSTVPSMENR
jgi:hypothetical protein